MATHAFSTKHDLPMNLSTLCRVQTTDACSLHAGCMQAACSLHAGCIRSNAGCIRTNAACIRSNAACMQPACSLHSGECRLHSLVRSLHAGCIRSAFLGWSEKQLTGNLHMQITYHTWACGLVLFQLRTLFQHRPTPVYPRTGVGHSHF